MHLFALTLGVLAVAFLYSSVGHCRSGGGCILSIALVAAIATGLGGFAGAYLGSRRSDSAIIKRTLARVLLIAGHTLAFAGVG